MTVGLVSGRLRSQAEIAASGMSLKPKSKMCVAITCVRDYSLNHRTSTFGIIFN